MLIDIKDHSSTPALRRFKLMHKSDKPVSEEWQKYSTFKAWYNAQSGGSMMIIRGDGYAPDNCALIPRDLVWVFTTYKQSKTGLPAGVTKSGDKFISMLGKEYFGTFDTPEEAHLVYANARKEKIAKAVFNQPTKVREAAMKNAMDMMYAAALACGEEPVLEEPEPVTTPEEDMEMVDSYTDMVSVAVRKGYKFELSFDEYRTAMLSSSEGREHDIQLAYKYQQKRDSTKERGIEFKLGFDKYRELMTSTHCAYTGAPFVVNQREHPRTRTLERINPDIGYTDNNTITVTLEANALKNVIVDTPIGTMDAESFRKLADTVLANQELVDIMNLRNRKTNDKPTGPVKIGCQRETYADWRRKGRTVIQGQKATGKNAEGTPTFALAQTRKLDR